MESEELFEVTKNIQKKDQLQYCAKCKAKHKPKTKATDDKHKVATL